MGDGKRSRSHVVVARENGCGGIRKRQQRLGALQARAIGEVALNIEANHATLSGHTFEHEIAMARALGVFGSIDANRGDPQNGWDTDQFPKSVEELTLAMLEIIRAGGFTTGGFNFDAKVAGKALMRLISSTPRRRHRHDRPRAPARGCDHRRRPARGLSQGALRRMAWRTWPLVPCARGNARHDRRARDPEQPRPGAALWSAGMAREPRQPVLKRRAGAAGAPALRQRG